MPIIPESTTIDFSSMPNQTRQDKSISIDFSLMPNQTKRVDKFPSWTDIERELPDTIKNNYGDKIKNSLSLSSTFEIDPVTAFDLHDTFKNELKEASFYDKAVGSLKSGMGDMYSGIGNYLKMEGIDGDIADKYINYGNKLRLAYIPPVNEGDMTWERVTDPEWLSLHLLRSVPFTLSLIPAAVVGAYVGVGGAGLLGLGTFGTTILGAIGGAILSRPIESAFEGASAYEEALQRGKTKNEAANIGNEVFRGNLKLVGLDAVQFAAAFTPLKYGKGISSSLMARVGAGAGKLGAIALSEGGEERYQEYLQMKALGDKAEFFNLDNPRMNEASVIGAIFGLGMAGTGSVWTHLKNQTIKTMPDNLKEEFDNTKTNLIVSGMDEQKAEIKALDTIASIPEGKEHIENVITDLKTRGENITTPQTEAIKPEAPITEAEIEAREDTQLTQLLEGDRELTDDDIDKIMEGEDIGEPTEVTKPDTEDLINREQDEVKQHVDMSIIAANKGKMDIAEAEAEKARANGEALKLEDGEEIDRKVEADLSRLPEPQAGEGKILGYHYTDRQGSENIQREGINISKLGKQGEFPDPANGFWITKEKLSSPLPEGLEGVSFRGTLNPKHFETVKDLYDYISLVTGKNIQPQRLGDVKPNHLLFNKDVRQKVTNKILMEGYDSISFGKDFEDYAHTPNDILVLDIKKLISAEGLEGLSEKTSPLKPTVKESLTVDTKLQVKIDKATNEVKRAEAMQDIYRIAADCLKGG